MAVGVVVTTEENRESLIEALNNLNAEAKALTRRGPVGTLNPRHGELHAAMSLLVDGILFRQELGLD